MPQSRNRHGHSYHPKADIPAAQRVKGRVIWAILFAIFAGLMAYFAAGNNYIVVVLVAAAGAVAGYYVGKSMERDVRG